MRGMQSVAIGLTLALPATAQAATPAKPTAAVAAPAKPAVQPATVPIAIKRVAMSQEGNAIVARINATPDTRLQQIQAELRGIQQTNFQFVSGSPVDLEKLDASLRREAALFAEMRTRANDRMLMILRALSESDRIAYLQRSVQVAKVPNAPKSPVGKPGPASAPAAVAPAPVPATRR